MYKGKLVEQSVGGADFLHQLTKSKSPVEGQRMLAPDVYTKNVRRGPQQTQSASSSFLPTRFRTARVCIPQRIPLYAGRLCGLRSQTQRSLTTLRGVHRETVAFQFCLALLRLINSYATHDAAGPRDGPDSSRQVYDQDYTDGRELGPRGRPREDQ